MIILIIIFLFRISAEGFFYSLFYSIFYPIFISLTFVSYRLFSNFSIISSISFSVMTSGGTRRSTSLPAEITSSPFSSALEVISETVHPATTSPCIKPFPRLAVKQSYFSTSSSSFFSRYGVTSLTCSTILFFSNKSNTVLTAAQASGFPP